MGNNKGIKLIKRDGEFIWYSHRWVKELIKIAANRVLIDISKEEVDTLEKKFEEDMRYGFYCLEEKFNSIISSRGDYPFITITFGISRDKYAIMASRAAIYIRKQGHGKEGHKQPVLFPKLVFFI
ncbi:MAG: hypothetical protein K6G11_05330 [Lachnospiraceae bacterium]|nr:hypothetical protein [Lachnospiraceae bacterium]